MGSETGTADGPETDGPETGGELCSDEPEANAQFVVDLDQWPAAQSSTGFEVAADCTVKTVQEQGDELVTTLECDDGGELRPATLHIAVSAEGSPVWAEDDVVALEYVYRYDSDGFLDWSRRSLSLRRPDGTLLVAAFNADGIDATTFLNDTPAQHLAPVSWTENAEACGWVADDVHGTATPMGLELNLDGEMLDLLSGQQGTLMIPDSSDRLAVDLHEATVGHCCHFLKWYELLVRRIQ